MASNDQTERGTVRINTVAPCNQNKGRGKRKLGSDRKYKRTIIHINEQTVLGDTFKVGIVSVKGKRIIVWKLVRSPSICMNNSYWTPVPYSYLRDGVVTDPHAD